MDSLSRIATKYNTDKHGHHDFTKIYEVYLRDIRHLPVILIEVGIGGYEFIDRGGGSLQMFKEYFPKGSIHGIDIYDKSFINQDRISTYIGSQTDKIFLNSVVNKTGNPDVILDDGGHVSPNTIRTFEILYPLLKSGGYYFLEDVHTSGWPGEYQGCENPKEGNTILNYIKNLTDQLNWEVWKGEYRTEFSNTIEFIHFYKEVIIIKKK